MSQKYFTELLFAKNNVIKNFNKELSDNVLKNFSKNVLKSNSKKCKEQKVFAILTFLWENVS